MMYFSGWIFVGTKYFLVAYSKVTFDSKPFSQLDFQMTVLLLVAFFQEVICPIGFSPGDENPGPKGKQGPSLNSFVRYIVPLDQREGQTLCPSVPIHTCLRHAVTKQHAWPVTQKTETSMLTNTIIT